MSRLPSQFVPWPIERLLHEAGVVPGEQLSCHQSVTCLTDDSRAVTTGSCFVAVRGAACDGHDFVGSAVRSGAAVVVVDRPVDVPKSTCVVRVEDSRAALAKLAAAFYGLRGPSRLPLRLIGVTGTNGKTTVVWLLRAILRAAGRPTAMLGTVEYDLIGERKPSPLTTPGAIELCRNLAAAQARGATDAAMEVSSHALDQRRVDGLTFDAAVFTNLTGDHLDYHKTMDAYFASKRRLFEMLSPASVAVLNADDPRSEALRQATRSRVLTYGLEAAHADESAKIERMDRTGTQLAMTTRGEVRRLRTTLIGRHNVQNILAAALTADAMGVPWEAVREGLETIRGVPGRLQRAEPAGWPFSVFVDYAHTDDALRNVLTALRPLTTGRLLCVFGCGGDRDRSKRPRMAAVVEELSDVAYVTSDNPRTESPRAIVDDILKGFKRGRRCRIEDDVDRRRAIQTALADAGEGDTVLIAGKGHENYQIVGEETFPFDDVEEARRAMDAAALSREVA